MYHPIAVCAVVVEACYDKFMRAFAPREFTVVGHIVDSAVTKRLITARVLFGSGEDREQCVLRAMGRRLLYDMVDGEVWLGHVRHTLFGIPLVGEELADATKELQHVGCWRYMSRECCCFESKITKPRGSR